MAFIQMNVMSYSLMRTVPVNVILPADKFLWGQKREKGRKYKTLYLLHGVFGNYTDWVNGTRIQRFAEERDLAVVMPSGDNAFYLDHKARNDNYGEFIGRELVELTRNIFPLSEKREDTFIGGLSMGGYGALRNGFKYNDTFGAAIGLSAALILDGIWERTDKGKFFLDSRSYAEECFGELEGIVESDRNPEFLVKRIKEEGGEMPLVYLACGLSDGLLEANRKFADFLEESGVKCTFETGEGGHDWDFWDTYIKKAVEWLPADTVSKGINSGNVM